MRGAVPTAKIEKATSGVSLVADSSLVAGYPEAIHKLDETQRDGGSAFTEQVSKLFGFEWSGREDSNLRPPGPEFATDLLTY